MLKACDGQAGQAPGACVQAGSVCPCVPLCGSLTFPLPRAVRLRRPFLNVGQCISLQGVDQSALAADLNFGYLLFPENKGGFIFFPQIHCTLFSKSAALYQLC